MRVGFGAEPGDSIAGARVGLPIQAHFESYLAQRIQISRRLGRADEAQAVVHRDGLVAAEAKAEPRLETGHDSGQVTELAGELRCALHPADPTEPEERRTGLEVGAKAAGRSVLPSQAQSETGPIGLAIIAAAVAMEAGFRMPRERPVNRALHGQRGNPSFAETAGNPRVVTADERRPCSPSPRSIGRDHGAGARGQNDERLGRYPKKATAHGGLAGAQSSPIINARLPIPRRWSSSPGGGSSR